MNAIVTIMSDLNKVFAPMDLEALEAIKTWATERVNALRDYLSSAEYRVDRSTMSISQVYAKKFSIAGGKGWYDVFEGRSIDMIQEVVVKHCNDIIKKRNLSITNKLIKANVTQVAESTYTYTNDGFNGCYVVETDSGKKVVRIETIVAGGYNVQCRHMRVLVKVK